MTRISLSIGALSIAFIAPISAQQNELDDNSRLETVVVTGSRSARTTVLDSSVPIDVLDSKALRNSGAVASELGEAIARLAPAFNFPRQSNSGSSDLVRAGQLRGLSPDQLLVLVNGQRRHTSAIVNSETKIGRGTTAVDFNAIPLNAVKRVEVLRDGAGAQYGSDAIAGVINVILDDEPGFSSNVTFGLHDTSVDAIGRDRDDGETVTLDVDYGFKLEDDGFVKLGANYRNRNGTNRAGFDSIPFFVEPTAANLALQGQSNYAEGDPDVAEIQLWYNFVKAVGAVELFGFGTGGDRESTGGAAFFRYPDANDNIRAVYPNGFRPETRGNDKDLATTLGARHSFADWELSVAGTYGRNEFEFGVDNSLNASLGSATPTGFDSGEFVFSQFTGSVDAVRRFDRVSVATGLEYRREDYATREGESASFAAGPFDGPPGAQAGPGLTPANEVSIDRDVYGVYLDFSADVTDSLVVNLAGRFDEYSDFGNAFTAKGSGRWEFLRGIALRGAVSNSFRAPNLAQIGFSDTTLNFGENRTTISTITARVDSPIARSLGAQSLEEETSLNLSAGVTVERGAFALSIDAFRIEVDDRITLSERLFGEAIEDFVATFPGGAGVASVRFFTNAVDTRTEGVDIVVSYATPLAGGNLGVSASYNYSDTEIRDLRATTPELNAVAPGLLLVGVEEINTLEDATPNNKTVVSVTWDTERFNLLGRVTRYGEATRVFNFGGGFEPEQTYAAEYQVDVEGGVNVTKNTYVAAGATNLLDNYPDESSADINFFGNLPYDILSPIGINGRYLYLRGRLRF